MKKKDNKFYRIVRYLSNIHLFEYTIHLCVLTFAFYLYGKGYFSDTMLQFLCTCIIAFAYMNAWVFESKNCEGDVDNEK